MENDKISIIISSYAIKENSCEIGKDSSIKFIFQKGNPFIEIAADGIKYAIDGKILKALSIFMDTILVK